MEATAQSSAESGALGQHGGRGQIDPPDGLVQEA